VCTVLPTFSKKKVKKKLASHPGPKPMPLTPAIRETALKFIGMGLNYVQLAEALNVSHEKLRQWRIQHPDFDSELRNCRLEIEAKLVRTLLRRATGARIRATKIFCKDGVVTKVPYQENLPPDVNAIMAWLTNRAPERWKRTRGDEPPADIPAHIEAPVIPTAELAQLSDAELAAIYNKALEAAGGNKRKP
jgi:hypothetical protein